MNKGLIHAAGWAGLAVVGILALGRLTPAPDVATRDATTAAPVAPLPAVSSAAADSSELSEAVVSVTAPASEYASASSSSSWSSSLSAPVVVAAVEDKPAKPLNRAGQRCQARLAAIVARHEVSFAFDTYELTPQGKRTIRDIHRELTRCPAKVKLTITGHTDSVGSAEQNRLVSAGRAVAAMNALTKLGWPDNRVSAKGVGSADPIASNRSAAGRRMNRRIVFTLSPAS